MTASQTGPDDSDRFSIQPIARHRAAESFARAVELGLTAASKHLPCRFLYDERGSQLFEAICDVPEYYPTRVERGILADQAGELARCVSQPAVLVELGSGSAAKTRLVIEAFLARTGELEFVPIDISRSILEESARELLNAYPKLTIRALEAEYEDGLEQLQEHDEGPPRLILWLGSSIGNLSRKDAAIFLQAVQSRMRPCDRLLVGVDLRKDASMLERAYDDAQGVTAAFNLNLLERINRELGGSFDPDAFEHRAVYLEDAGRVEMHLVSRHRQSVTIEELGREIHFAADETIHTENSYKYSEAEIDALAATAGLSLERRWLDGEGLFSLNLMHAR